MEKAFNPLWRICNMAVRKQYVFFIFILAILFLSPACTRHQVEIKPVEIKPIHITIDVNVKVDRALDDFFEDLDKKQAE
jgi:hypothetical protein